VPERHSAWPVVKACSRETHSPSRASEIYGRNAFQIEHIHTPLLSTVVAYTLLNTAHTVGCAGELVSVLAVAIIPADATVTPPSPK